MIPLALLACIALETTVYLAVGRLWLGAGWLAAWAGAAGGLLGVRAGMNAVTWVFAASHASPAAPLGIGRRIRLIAGEYLAFLVTFLVVLPLERLWMPADRLAPGPRPPILLVHGYGCSRGVWWLLRRRLEAAGHAVATVSLAPAYLSLGQLAEQLAERIEAVCRASGSRQVVLVAHSMGGLVARCYLARHGGERVARLLTLATPHRGSELCHLGLGRNAREMTPGSSWLRDMAAEILPVPAVALRNPYDNYVMPQDSQRLPGARDIELPPVGHIAMLYDRRIARLLIDLLADPTP